MEGRTFLYNNAFGLMQNISDIAIVPIRTDLANKVQPSAPRSTNTVIYGPWCSKILGLRIGLPSVIAISPNSAS